MLHNVLVRSLIFASPAKQSNSSRFPIKLGRLSCRIPTLVVPSVPFPPLQELPCVATYYWDYVCGHTPNKLVLRVAHPRSANKSVKFDGSPVTFLLEWWAKEFVVKTGPAQSVQTGNELLPCGVVWDSAIHWKSVIGLDDDGP